MDIKDKTLAAVGRGRMEWAQKSMPVLQTIQKRFEQEKPFAGIRMAACLHVTTETGVLMQMLKAGGAEVRLCASNPLSTQDDVAATLVVDHGIDVYAIKGEGKDTFYKHIHAVLDLEPHITMDDGADLVSTLHTERTELLAEVKGGTEETTTGVIRLKSMADKGVLKYPVISVNDADTKHMFDNRYGTGQSTIDGIIRATNRLLAGSVFVVCGYGWCGRGVAMRASGMGARVIVTEVDPIRALEAVMDGYQVSPISEAAAVGDFFCTVTGDVHVITLEHMEKMKDGVIICNSGHFNVECDIEGLESIAVESTQLRESLDEYQLKDGRKIYVLGEGRLVNLAAAEGHPSGVIDLSFSNQALGAEYLINSPLQLTPTVHKVPEGIDRMIASLKLESLNINIDVLTEEQEQYLSAWETGT